MAKVVLEHLYKSFGKVVAVKDLNLEVEDGKFACFLGPSGCGKTTTLRMIAGLDKPDSGKIYIDDNVVNDLDPVQRNIAMVFQFYALYPAMTVRENLAFPLEQRKVPKEEIRKVVRETADVLRIDGVLDKVATKLTSGEKQRVAIGRALVRRPKVYLMDEALTNLDAGLRAVMRVELSRLQRELKQTMIYVTHDQLEGMTMADKIAVMNQGELLQYDTPETIYNHPKNLFVAGFVGTPTMNFADCTVTESNGKSALDFGSFKLALPSDMSEHLKGSVSSHEFVLGIRPQDIKVSTGSAPDAVEAKIDVTEMVGDKVIINVQVDGNALQVEADRRLVLESGRKIWLIFDKVRLHLFERKTGRLVV